VQGVDVPGYASIMVAVLFMGGLNLMTLGILGEYVGRIYTEAKQRPLYMVRERIGFDEPHAGLRGGDVTGIEAVPRRITKGGA
jgi:hypothetical protein